MRVADDGAAARRARPARYGEGARPNLPAMLGALAVAVTMFSPLLVLNIAGGSKAKDVLTVIDLQPPPLSAAPPPPQPVPPRPPEPDMRRRSPIVVPELLVPTPAPLLPFVAAPAPPAPDMASVAPQPQAPPSVAPVIETVGNLSSTMLGATPPRYPHESRRKREEGVVTLSVVLGVDGKVAEIAIARSSGFERLDKAALMAVRHWRWSPTRRGGVPVMVTGLVEIPFVLQH